MKVAIFDLDGTLVNSLADIAEAANHAMKQLGFPTHELDKFNYFVGDGLKELIPRVLPQDRQDKYDEALEIYKEYYGTHYMVKTSVYDGIKPLLEKLSENGVTLAVASNKTEVFTKNVVSHYFGDSLFSAVYGRAENRATKPDPAILNVIMQQLDVKPSDCFMIGDTNVDIRTGKNAGIKTIGCLWGFRTLEELKEAGANFIAQKPENIAEFIL